MMMIGVRIIILMMMVTTLFKYSTGSIYSRMMTVIIMMTLWWRHSSVITFTLNRSLPKMWRSSVEAPKCCDDASAGRVWSVLTVNLLDDHVVVVPLLEEVQQFDNVGVVQLQHDGHLITYMSLGIVLKMCLTVCYSTVWYGLVWYDMVCNGMVWYGRYVIARYGMVWYGMVW